MPNPTPDLRGAHRRALDDRIAAESPLPAADLPPGATPSPVEAHLPTRRPAGHRGRGGEWPRPPPRPGRAVAGTLARDHRRGRGLRPLSASRHPARLPRRVAGTERSGAPEGASPGRPLPGHRCALPRPPIARGTRGAIGTGSNCENRGVTSPRPPLLMGHRRPIITFCGRTHPGRGAGGPIHQHPRQTRQAPGPTTPGPGRLRSGTSHAALGRLRRPRVPLVPFGRGVDRKTTNSMVDRNLLREFDVTDEETGRLRRRRRVERLRPLPRRRPELRDRRDRLGQGDRDRRRPGRGRRRLQVRRASSR